MVLANSLLFFSLHCQISITFQPSFLKSRFFFLSLALFSAIFVFQYFLFELGNLPARHECPCQKQPLTNITVSYFGRTISGVPGYRLSFFLNRKPLENRYFLTKISGSVSLPEILAISWLRFFLEYISGIKCKSN